MKRRIRWAELRCPAARNPRRDDPQRINEDAAASAFRLNRPRHVDDDYRKTLAHFRRHETDKYLLHLRSGLWPADAIRRSRNGERPPVTEPKHTINSEPLRIWIMCVKALKLSFNGGPNLRVVISLEFTQYLARWHGDGNIRALIACLDRIPKHDEVLRVPSSLGTPREPLRNSTEAPKRERYQLSPSEPERITRIPRDS